jgi:hypothetical protein
MQIREVAKKKTPLASFLNLPHRKNKIGVHTDQYMALNFREGSCV